MFSDISSSLSPLIFFPLDSLSFLMSGLDSSYILSYSLFIRLHTDSDYYTFY